MTGPFYILHPGKVRSRTDGQAHYINYSRLVALYALPPEQCRPADDRSSFGCRQEDAIHLYPREDGNYDLTATPKTAGRVGSILPPAVVVICRQGKNYHEIETLHL